MICRTHVCVQYMCASLLSILWSAEHGISLLAEIRHCRISVAAWELNTHLEIMPLSENDLTAKVLPQSLWKVISVCSVPRASLCRSCVRSTELAFGNLVVLENILHQLCKALGISLVDAERVTVLLCNILNDIL